MNLQNKNAIIYGAGGSRGGAIAKALAGAAARVMMKQGSGVILSLTATPGGIGYPYTGGFALACCAVESLSRNLASESGRRIAGPLAISGGTGSGNH